MTPVAWALEARAIRARQDAQREFVLTLAKTLHTQFRRSLVEILGCNLLPAPGAAADAPPEENYTPLALLIGNPQMWATTKKTWDREAAARKALADKTNDSFVSTVDEIGDMEPLVEDLIEQEETMPQYAQDPVTKKLYKLQRPGELPDDPQVLKDLGIEVSDEPFKEF